MIRESQKCPQGHVYMTVRPTNYKGAAVHPKECPVCRRK